MPESNLDRWAREVVEQSKGSIWGGLALTLGLHLFVQVPAFFLLIFTIIPGEEGLGLAIYPSMFIGLSQVVYMIPAILIFRRRGDTGTAKGLMIGAALTFILNSTCNGLLFLNR